jgi:hypothetical protein
MKTALLSVLFSLLFIASCSTSKTVLSNEGMAVKVLTTKRGVTCDVVGKVVGENKEGSVELARNHARNLAGKKGASAIYFEEEIQNGSTWRVHSTAYRCE